MSGVLLALALGCADGSDAADTAASDCAADPRLTWDNWGSGFFHGTCASCHSVSAPDRHDAPTSYDFDTEQDVAAHADAIRSAVLERATMPIGGGIADIDLAYLDRYLTCVGGAGR